MRSAEAVARPGRRARAWQSPRSHGASHDQRGRRLRRFRRPRPDRRAIGLSVLDRAAQELEPGRVELVRSTARTRSGRSNRASSPCGDRLARQQDEVRGPVDQGELARHRRSSPTRSRRPVAPDSASVSAMFSVPRSDAQTSPTREPGGSAGDLVDELHVARPDEHRDDRHAAATQRLGLVGVERRRRDEVVVEPVEPVAGARRAARPRPRSGPGTLRRAAPRRSRRRRSCTRRTARGPAARAACARSRRRTWPRRPRRA